jgi:hypothetical protein
LLFKILIKMNKLFLLFSITLFSLSTFAQGSNLTVFSEDGERFYLILNGIRQNERPETNIRVAGLTQPYYSTKVIFENTSIADAERKMLYVQDAVNNPGGAMDVTYKIKKKKDNTFVIGAMPFSFVPIAQAPPLPPNVAVVQYNTAPMPAIGINVSHTTTTTTTTSDNMNSGGANISMGINVPGINVGINVNDMMGGMGGSTQVTQSTTTTTSSSGYGNTQSNYQTPPPPPAPSGNGCGYAMPSAEFGDLMTRVKGQSFSEQKMKVAKQGTKVNCPTVDQVRQIAKLMMMDEEKLEYIKYAYDFCWNKKDYYKLSDVFSFSGTTDEFNNFLGN